MVLDANVLLKVFIPEVLSDEAGLLFSKALEDRATLIVPDLIFPESGNILWKKHRLKELADTEVEDISGQILSVPFLVIPSETVLPLAINMGLIHDITVYDALYLSVALVFEAKLITADRKLVNRLNNTDLKQSIQWLGDVSVI